MLSKRAEHVIWRRKEEKLRKKSWFWFCFRAGSTIMKQHEKKGNRVDLNTLKRKGKGNRVSENESIIREEKKMAVVTVATPFSQFSHASGWDGTEAERTNVFSYFSWTNSLFGQRHHDTFYSSFYPPLPCFQPSLHLLQTPFTDTIKFK